MHKNYIDGGCVASRGEINNINPSDLSDIIGQYASMDQV